MDRFEIIDRKIKSINDGLPTDLSINRRLEEVSRRFRITKNDAKLFIYKR